MEKQRKGGYIALVEADPEKSTVSGEVMKPEDAYRTGTILHMKREVARKVFNTDIPDTLPMVFIDPEAVAKIKAMMPTGEEE